VNSSKGDTVEQLMTLTDGKGVDVAIEAVGFPVTFDICQQILKTGGRLANVGVHGKPVELYLEQLWIRNVKITTGLVSTSTTPMLLKTVQSGRINPQQLVTHRFPLEEIMQAYEVFRNAAREKAMKVILSND
jgi:alcohol dehydrogenase